MGRIEGRHYRIALRYAGDWHEAGVLARSAICGKDYVVVVEDGLGACSQKGERYQTNRRAHGHACETLQRNAGRKAGRKAWHGRTFDG